MSLKNAPGYSVFYATRNVVNIASEGDYLFTPNRIESNYGAILCHGAGSTRQYLDDANQPASGKISATLAKNGIPCLGAAMRGDSWANDQSVVDMESARTYLGTIVDNTKVHLFGTSMGAAVALRYAINHPDRVASITGIIPLTSIVNFYANNIDGLASAIATAWGVVYPADLPSGADLLEQAETLLDIPIDLHYAGNDTKIDSADVLAFAEKSRARVYGPVGSAGHTNTSIAAISGDCSHFVNFMKGSE